MRHGEAEPKSSGTKDGERKLTDEGRALNRKVLALAVELGPRKVDSILSSPLERAVQTAEDALGVLGETGRTKVEITDALEPTSTPYEFCGFLSRLDPNRTIFAVTHQPLVSDLLSSLLGVESERIAMPTSTIARLDFEKEPSGGSGVLKWLVSGHLSF